MANEALIISDRIFGGWRKDKWDPRDYLHKPRVAVPPTSVNMSNYLAAIRDQSQMNACVGFGLGINVCSVLKQLGIFVEWDSPQWIWNGGRFIEGTLTQNVGIEPGDGLDWLLKNGILPESDWPFSPDVLDQSAPSSARMAEATKYLDFAYTRVDNDVDGIISALADGHFVSLGAPWDTTQWINVGADGILPVPQPGDFVAGHETCLYGYDQSSQYFFGANSWGPSWAKGGCYLMPFAAIAFFKANGGYDAHYITFTNCPAPAPTPTPPTPTPTPTPSNCTFSKGLEWCLNKGYEKAGKKTRWMAYVPSEKTGRKTS